MHIIYAGVYGCSVNDITVGTVRSGGQIQGKPEWNVTVTNNCVCPQRLIKLACTGFRAVVEIDPSIFKREGADKCLLIQGNNLAGSASASIKFSYAWDPPFTFFVSEAVTVMC